MGAEMNERETLKLALEALDCICSPLHVREITKVGNAMKAIKEALAQSDQEPDDLTIAYMSGFHDGKNKYAPQPKPEPKPHVWFKTDNGWRKEEFEKTLVKKVPLDTTPPEPKPHVWFDFSNYDMYSSKEEFEKTLLNNVPQREWVGLTDEDKNNCLVSADPCECLAKPESHQLMEDVEAKLREKNGG